RRQRPRPPHTRSRRPQRRPPRPRPSRPLAQTLGPAITSRLDGSRLSRLAQQTLRGIRRLGQPRRPQPHRPRRRPPRRHVPTQTRLRPPPIHARKIPELALQKRKVTPSSSLLYPLPVLRERAG